MVIHHLNNWNPTDKWLSRIQPAPYQSVFRYFGETKKKTAILVILWSWQNMHALSNVSFQTAQFINSFNSLLLIDTGIVTNSSTRVHIVDAIVFCFCFSFILVFAFCAEYKHYLPRKWPTFTSRASNIMVWLVIGVTRHGIMGLLAGLYCYGLKIRQARPDENK